MNNIVLKAGREASVYRMHHWIFSGAIHGKTDHLKEGELIKILSSKNETLGFGHYSNSSISVRIIQFGGESLATDFWETIIHKAYNFRQYLGLTSCNVTNAYRLVHGEGDGLPGLIIDVYNLHAVIQCHTIGMYNHLEEIAHALHQVYKNQLKTIYNKSKESLGNSVSLENKFLHGNLEETIISENGNLFKVNWVTGQKTGFFVDQRENRNLLAQYCSGKSVLNLFCYSGGFSVYAGMNKASKIYSVDVSAKAIDLANENMLLNKIASAIYSNSTSDVSHFLSPSESYDIIICDPPAFAKSMNKRHQAVNGYKNLNAKVIKKVKPGGLLFTFSCSQVMDRELFQQTILAAALESKRTVKIIHHLSQAPDHPINIYHPEGSYLKGLVLYIED